MKTSITILFIFLVIPIIGTAVETRLESIKRNWSISSNDTSRVMALVEFADYYKMKRPDSAMFYGAKALTMARQIKYLKGELRAMHHIVLTQIILGNNAKALQIALQAIKIAEKHNRNREKGEFLFFQGMIYKQSKNYEKALSFFLKSKNHYDSIHDVTRFSLSQSFIGSTYLFLNNMDSALYYCQSSYDNQLKEKWTNYQAAFNLGKVQLIIGNTDLALALFRKSLLIAIEPSSLFDSNLAIAQLYQKTGNLNSCIYYGKNSLLIAQESKFISNIIDAYLFLSGLYEKRDIQKAFQYSKIAIAYKDSLYDLANKTAQETFIGFDEQERQQEIEAAHTEFQNRLRINAFSGITFTLLVIAIFLFWNSKLKQRAKQNIEKAYNQLKSTQAQLIQSEKMASLGELTAGIAHEIQNPLNFVNNFSEVSNELLSEMKTELKNNNKQEAIAIADDVIQNLEKILHHGKRADGIVKGMLQHSRSSSGIKEPTDINKLADEYFRLAYHGLRAKDKLFNATMKTDFDASIGKIDVVSQDIGRVILNLITNAFYAVSEKKNQQIEGYEPTVSVSTKRVGDKVIISVKDNGNGISPKVMDKIFQPFFTTKPAGQGTGLGLSMSYDIIKAHGGELKVETKEGEGAEFIILIPMNQ